jgi:hypothetical protein
MSDPLFDRLSEARIRILRWQKGHRRKEQTGCFDLLISNVGCREASHSE